MLLRIQSAEGTKRVEVSHNDSIQQLLKKACEVFGTSACRLYQDRQRQKELVASGRRTVKTSRLAHGDMLYMINAAQDTAYSMDVDQPSGSKEDSKASSSSSSSSRTNSRNAKVTVEEDLVDQLLVKQDGRIPGNRNPLLCHHKGNSRCIHCTDLDPWDEGYLKANNVKHMSFHTYVRKLKSGVDKGKFVQMSTLQCSIKPGCSDHPPWPQGICSACQPSAITLTRQPFRHVDTVVFENRAIVENFLTYWRTTGHQRAGLLYGRHVVHTDVPLGIRAEVAAIYEPPQEASIDQLKLLPDPNKPLVDDVARQLGLVCVGWLFTDLLPLDSSSGTVRHLRHSDTYFLSSHEVITAAVLQRQHPNPCTLAPDGFYGSKFATVIVTGDANNQVHMEGYQVSHQCESLVASGCLLPTLDAPELAYVKESTAKQYVPDVFFKEKDEYGNEVTRLGRPLPVEYLLLDLPVSTPNEPSHTFTETRENPFPIENRLVEGHLQDFSSLARYMRHTTSSDAEFLKRVSDFHLLVYLAELDVVPLRAELPPLLQAVKESDSAAAAAWRAGDAWSTVERLIEASPVSPVSLMPSSNGLGGAGPSGSGAPSGAASWTCAHCTFINAAGGGDVCDMCHLPR